MCEHLKIPPAKIFSRNLTKSQISVSYRILGPEGAKACAAALSVSTASTDNWMI